jgi:mono/diheme cytochrome c family protein
MVRQILRRVMPVGIVCATAVGVTSTAQDPPAPVERTGWRIPAGAEKEMTPLTVDDGVIAAGKKLFNSKCQRCHGSAGKGDGVDAEPRRQRSMDLTQATRAAANTDGVVFYKIWNGRSSPRMPTFSEELEREEVWSIVAFVQTLREKPAPQP